MNLKNHSLKTYWTAFFSGVARNLEYVVVSRICFRKISPYPVIAEITLTEFFLHMYECATAQVEQELTMRDLRNIQIVDVDPARISLGRIPSWLCWFQHKIRSLAKLPLE